MKKIKICWKYTWEQINARAEELGREMFTEFSEMHGIVVGNPLCKLLLYGIPRGGIHAAQAIVAAHPNYFKLTDNADEADLMVDDLLDSGATADKTFDTYKKPIYFLFNKQTDPDLTDKWLVFPWETDEPEGCEENVRRILQFVGEDPKREGLLDTPKRFIKAMKEYTAGYDLDPAEILKVSFDIGDSDPELTYDQMIMSGPLPYVSMCEHHMAPFEGHAWIAYLPAEQGKIAGLSKLARVLDAYARRLQVQERLTVQIANAIEKHLEPRGVAVLIRGRHMCQCHRGVKKDGRMMTSIVRGVFAEQSARNEFLEMVKLSSI